MASDPYSLRADGLEVFIKATPKARQNRVVGFTPQGLKVQVTAAPENGKANEAIAALLAGTLGVGKNAVHLLAGGTSAHKRILIEGDAAALLKQLQEL